MKTICILHFAIFLIIRTASAGLVHIQGVVSNAAGESLRCTVVGNSLLAKNVGIDIPLQNGSFHHQFEISAATFLSFSDGANYFAGLIEPGDSVFIEYDRSDFGNTISYRGAGKEKFEIAYAISQIKGVPRKMLAAAKLRSFPVDYMFETIDSLKDAANARTALSAGSMSRESQMQLLGLLAATELLAKQNSLVAVFGDSYGNILKNHQDKLSKASIERMQNLFSFDEAHYDSKQYVDAVKVVTTIYLEEEIQPGSSNFAEQKYQILSGMLPEKLRSPVLFLTLRSDISNSTGDVPESIFLGAADQLTDNRLKQSILDMLAERKLLKIGGNAPEFSVQNLSGEKVNLASFYGKTIYLDFWFAACGPCHSLFKSIAPVKKQFENDDRIVFLTVSVDNESTWKKAVTKFGIKGYHVFTENKLREHPIIQSYNIDAYPTTFIIDPAGRFRSVRPSQNPDMLRKQIEESVKASPK